MFQQKQAIRPGRVGLNTAASPARTDLIQPSAVLLLSEVLARLSGIDRLKVQIVAASAQGGTGNVAQELAAAAAVRFGRTLLVSPATASADTAGARGLTWLMTGAAGTEPDGLIPNPQIPGLYHTSVVTDQPGPIGLPLDSWLDGPQAFRMIVVDSPAIAADPRTLAGAARCHGSVLAVAAGVTTLAELRVSARQLANAGVTLIGTVLHDAPRIRFGFKRLRRAG